MSVEKKIRQILAESRKDFKKRHPSLKKKTNRAHKKRHITNSRSCSEDTRCVSLVVIAPAGYEEPTATTRRITLPSEIWERLKLGPVNFVQCSQGDLYDDDDLNSSDPTTWQRHVAEVMYSPENYLELDLNHRLLTKDTIESIYKSDIVPSNSDVQSHTIAMIFSC